MRPYGWLLAGIIGRQRLSCAICSTLSCGLGKYAIRKMQRAFRRATRIDTLARGGIRDKDITSIINGPMVARYRTFVGNNIQEIFHQKLMSPVNPELIQKFYPAIFANLFFPRRDRPTFLCQRFVMLPFHAAEKGSVKPST